MLTFLTHKSSIHILLFLIRKNNNYGCFKKEPVQGNMIISYSSSLVNPGMNIQGLETKQKIFVFRINMPCLHRKYVEKQIKPDFFR